MPELLFTTLGLDPATAELLWTLSLTLLLVVAGGLTLAVLPWTDREIAEVDSSFRSLWEPALRRVQARRS